LSISFVHPRLSLLYSRELIDFTLAALPALVGAGAEREGTGGH